MNPLEVCAFAVAATGILCILRATKPELSGLASAVAGVLIFVYVVTEAAPLVSFLKTAASELGAESGFVLMLKALCIALCCQMTSELCRDCGEGALASRVELAGKAGILMLCVPALQQIFSLAKDLLK